VPYLPSTGAGTHFAAFAAFIALRRLLFGAGAAAFAAFIAFFAMVVGDWVRNAEAISLVVHNSVA
jgi:hypothetical protein